jgi:hypothetical protein
MASVVSMRRLVLLYVNWQLELRKLCLELPDRLFIGDASRSHIRIRRRLVSWLGFSLLLGHESGHVDLWIAPERTWPKLWLRLLDL